mgnify:CR=1 FL=1
MVRSHPIALSLYFSCHDVLSPFMKDRVASFPLKKSTAFFATYLVYHRPGLKDSKTKQVKSFYCVTPFKKVLFTFDSLV